MPTTKPLRTMAASDRATVRELLQADNNLDWLLTYVCTGIRHMLTLWPLSDPPDVVQAYTERLGQRLSQAILDKLLRYYPQAFRYGAQKLLAYYPDRAGDLINQAICHFYDTFLDDAKAFPQSPLAERAQRLAPRLSALPNLRGKSVMGDTYRLWLYEVYERNYETVKQTLGVKAWKNIANPDDPITLQERAELLKKAFDISQPSDEMVLWSANVDDKDLTEWAKLSPHDIALELTVKAAKASPGLKKPNTLRMILPRMRRLSKALEQAWEQALSH